jgi:hypothetical protein
VAVAGSWGGGGRHTSYQAEVVHKAVLSLYL